MRIPNINQTGVPGAEQLSLGAISSAAQAKMRTSNALTKVVDDYQVMSNKAEAIAEYGQKYESSLMSMDAAYDDMVNQPHFDKDNNPTYRDLEKRWSTASMNHVTATLKGFSNKTAAAKYQEDVSSYLRGKANDMRGVIRKRQVDYSNGVLAYQIEAYKTQPDGAAKTSVAIKQQVQLGHMNPEDGVKLLQDSLEEHASTQLTMSIESAADDSTLDSLRLSLLQNDNPYLTLSAIQGGFNAIRQKEDHLDSQKAEAQTEHHSDLLIKIVSGELTSQTDIDLALRGTSIDGNQYDDLTQRLQTDLTGPEVDDWREYQTVSLNLQQYTKAEILTNVMLTRDTRIKLVSELAKLNDENDKDMDWVATQSGREAKRRIMAAFENTNKLGALFGTASAEASEALTELYDAVQGVPLGKRESAVLKLANDIIKVRKSASDGSSGGPKIPDTWEEIVAEHPPGKKRTEILKQWGDKTMKTVPANAFTMDQDDSGFSALAVELGVGE